jgi:DNA-binding winged helix-turn-helix (wHTH) protein
MAAGYAFDRFILDTDDRRLKADGKPVELNARYFDALALLVRAQGQLVSKDSFLSEVWRGVPVTDEALTQCIRTLRRQLGDDASAPRFIETVPKHGYRFLPPVEVLENQRTAGRGSDRWRCFVVTGTAGVAGGAIAGVFGGLAYGLLSASNLAQPGAASISILLVLICVTALVGLIGAAGVSLGIATASFARPGSCFWSVAGGAGGGFFVGAFGKLLGLDAFNLLVGQSPGNITGGSEGLVLGAAVGLAACLASRSSSLRWGAAVAALCGGASGLAVSASGGRLMLGSLDLLERGFPGSRIRLDVISRIFGEASFGPVTLAVTAALEGALFTAGVVAAMQFARRRDS